MAPQVARRTRVRPSDATRAVCSLRTGARRPLCYVNLNGVFGLVEEDPQWQKMLPNESDGSLAAVGTQFVTHSLISATHNAQCFADPSGFGVPMRTAAARIEFAPQDSPVVAFVSRATSSHEAHGKRTRMLGHSLIQTASSTYDLPPLSTVTLESVQPAGSWEAFGVRVQQPLLVVCVSYAIETFARRKLRYDAPTGAQDAAAVRIQSVYRGKATRAKIDKGHYDFMGYFNFQQQQAKERELAATRIQRHARGNVARRRLRARQSQGGMGGEGDENVTQYV